MQIIFFAEFGPKFVLKCAAKNLKIGSQLKKVLPQNDFEQGISIVKTHRRGLNIFPQNFNRNYHKMSQNT